MDRNQTLPSDAFTTTDPSGTVRIRMSDASPEESYPPVSVPTAFERIVAKGPEKPALKVKRNGQWITWNFTQYLRDIKIVAKSFIKLGLEPRHGVAILGFNSPEWFLSDLGAVFADGIAAGIYPTNNEEACKYIVQNCRANIIVVEDKKQLEKIRAIQGDLTHLKAIVQYTGETDEDVISWDALLKMGKAEPNDNLEERMKGIAINQCCHLVYTSGTTGHPKGVMLSHDNLTYTARCLIESYNIIEGEERLVSYLPLSHVAANMTDIFLTALSLTTLYFADKSALKGTLIDTLKDARPTMFLGVPRVWEKMQERMLEIGRQNKGLKRQIGKWAKKTGLEHNMSILNGNTPRNELRYKIANKIVFKKIKFALGLDKCIRNTVAGAPMPEETIQYFMSLDINILDMYGMSECSGPQNVNTKGSRKLGTIGKPMSGFHTKVSASGELCYTGRNIMMGYLYDEERTKEAFDEYGWLKSGDLGFFGSDGFIRITGRIKELIITSGGENVPPVPIEDAIKHKLPCISNAMIIGDRRKFLSCLLTLKTEVDPDTLLPQPSLAAPALEWCDSVGSKATTVDEAIGDLAVSKAVQLGIDHVNTEATSNAQRIQKWIILPKDFAVPTGELGPTLKMRRHVILSKYAAQVEAFYK